MELVVDLLAEVEQVIPFDQRIRALHALSGMGNCFVRAMEISGLDQRVLKLEAFMAQLVGLNLAKVQKTARQPGGRLRQWPTRVHRVPAEECIAASTAFCGVQVTLKRSRTSYSRTA
jgi:hypothetical protein